MKRRTGVTTGLLALTMVAAVSGCGQNSGKTSTGNSASGGTGKVITIKISNDIGANTLKGKSWRHFAQDLKTKLGSKVKVEISDNGSLYSQSEQLQALEQNDVQFIAPVPGVISGQFPKVAVFGLPYLFKSPDMIQAALDDPNIGGAVFADLAKKNVDVMGVWLNGWRMVSSKTPVKSLSDMKGLKIRVPTGNNYVDTFKAMGANVDTINWGEVPTSLQQGVINAVEPTPNANLSDKIYQVAPYITNTDHILDIYLIATNQKWLDSLPKDVQTAVKDSMKDTDKWNWDQTNSANSDALKTMKSDGAHLIELDSSQLAEWQKATLPVINEFKPIVGADLVNRVQQLAQKYQWQRP